MLPESAAASASASAATPAPVFAPPQAAAPARPSRLLVALFFIALVAALKIAQPLLLPIVVAVILTFVLTPGVRWLHRRGIPSAIGAALLVAALLGTTALLGLALSGPAAQWLERAPNTIETLVARIDRLRASIPALAPPAKPPPTPAPRVSSRSAPTPGVEPAAEAPPPADPIKERIAAASMELTGELLGGTLTFAIAAAATVILLYFLLASEYWMLTSTIAAIQRRRTRALVLSGVRAAQTEIGQLIAALALINLCVGAATGLAVWALGLQSPVLWGALAFALNFIPYIGPLVMGTLLLVAGLVSFESAGLVLAPAAAFLAIHFVEANLVTPTLIGRRLALSPLSVFLSVMFFAWLWGIAGALIAMPLLVGVRSVCKRNRRWKLLCVYLEGQQKEAPSLRSLIRLGPRRRAVLPKV